MSALFQPPLFSRIHSIRIPLLSGPLREVIAFATPQTGERSEIHKIPEDSGCASKEANIVLVEARPKDARPIENMVRANKFRPASLRHVCSLAAYKPRLHQELALGVLVMAVIATETVLLDGNRRVPLVWWSAKPGDVTGLKYPPEHTTSLFWEEDAWEHYYWRAYIA